MRLHKNIILPILRRPFVNFNSFNFSYFRERDYNELKVIELEKDHSKEYL